MYSGRLFLEFVHHLYVTANSVATPCKLTIFRGPFIEGQLQGVAEDDQARQYRPVQDVPAGATPTECNTL